MKKIFRFIYNLLIKPIIYTIFFLATLLLFLFVKALEIFGEKFPLGKNWKIKIFKLVHRLYDKIALIDKPKEESINRVNIIKIAFKNMKAKKSRTFITIGGMSVGIGAIVFLVSLGYGVQELVISRVASLDEMKQINVDVQSGSPIKINSETLNKFQDIKDIEKNLPLISVVGKVNYKDSVSDMAVYGVTSDYLRNSAIKPTAGEIFDSNDLTVKNPALEVIEEDKKNDSIEGSILNPEEQEVELIEEDTVSVYTQKETIVLGESTSLEEVDITELDIEGIDLGEFETVNQSKIKQVSIEHLEKREAVVNRAMLEVLNISEDQAIGSEFEVSFEVVGNLLENPEEKIKSLPTTYKIVGVTPDQKTPLFYVPFINLRSLGIVNFSQIKVITKNKESLPLVRSKIESLGYSTSSVVDTVNQINGLFKIVRFILALLGMVALSVASLGMFNTLTVSLLERTREVGLMKSMGMKSYEVRELFLVESLMMGLFGGIIGLILGYILGELVGWILSVFSLAKGVGTLDISHIPFIFIMIIISLSLFVGIVTGIYPAQRAKKISALNALRYE